MNLVNRNISLQNEQEKLKKVLNEASQEEVEHLNVSWDATSLPSWLHQFRAWKGSEVSEKVWHSKLPSLDECIYAAQYGLEQAYYQVDSLVHLAQYPFDEDPNGQEKAQSVAPFFQKALLYLLLTVDRRSRIASVEKLTIALSSSSCLSKAIKEKNISQVQWKMWEDFGLTSPETSDVPNLKGLLKDAVFKKALKMLPDLVQGTVLNVHTYRLKEPTSYPMLRMSQLKNTPQGPTYATWRVVFEKHGIQKELGKTKKRLEKMTQSSTVPKRRM